MLDEQREALEEIGVETAPRATDGGEDEYPDPEEMGLEELREEYSERADIGFPEPEEHDRKMALWNELRHRVDVEQPPCPHCGEGNWGQAPGEPVQCNSCGEYLGENPELHQEIRSAWDEIMGRDDEKDLVTDGGHPEPPDKVRFSPPPEVTSVKTRGDEPANPTRVEIKVKYWTHRGAGEPLNSAVTFYTRSDPAEVRDVEGGDGSSTS